MIECYRAIFCESERKKALKMLPLKTKYSPNVHTSYRLTLQLLSYRIVRCSHCLGNRRANKQRFEKVYYLVTRIEAKTVDNCEKEYLIYTAGYAAAISCVHNERSNYRL